LNRSQIAASQAAFERRLTDTRLAAINVRNASSLEKALHDQLLSAVDRHSLVGIASACHAAVAVELRPAVEGTQAESLWSEAREAQSREAAAPPRYRLSIIMLYNSGDAAQQAVALVSQIRGGAPFSDIARRYSSDHSAANGGQMGPDDYTFLQQLLPRREWTRETVEVGYCA
jgi:parvulin-like peptidyl-prolyl isomerase